MNIKIGILKNTLMPWYNNCSLKGWTPSKNCLLPGSDVEILRELLRKINTSYQVVETQFATNEDFLKFGLSENIDTIAVTIINTSTINNSHNSFTFPVMFHPYSITYKLNDESFETYLCSLMKPFSATVWYYLIGLVILLYFAWFIISKCKLAGNRWKFGCKTPLEFFTFFQGDIDDENIIRIPTSKKLFFISVSIFTVILSALYQNGLLLSFKVGKQEISISTFSELVQLLEKDMVSVVTNDENWQFYKRVKESDGVSFEQLNRIFARKPYIKVKSSGDVKRYLLKGGYVFIATPYYLQRKYEAELCGLAVVNLNLEREWSGYIFRKNSTILPLLNEAISNSWQMINYYLDKYKILHPLQPNCEGTESSKLFALKLDHFSGPFILLVVGSMIGSLAILIETVKQCHKSKKYEIIDQFASS